MPKKVDIFPFSLLADVGEEDNFFQTKALEPAIDQSCALCPKVQEKNKKFSLLFFIEELYYWSGGPEMCAQVFWHGLFTFFSLQPPISLRLKAPKHRAEQMLRSTVPGGWQTEHHLLQRSQVKVFWTSWFGSLYSNSFEMQMILRWKLCRWDRGVMPAILPEPERVVFLHWKGGCDCWILFVCSTLFQQLLPWLAVSHPRWVWSSSVLFWCGFWSQREWRPGSMVCQGTLESHAELTDLSAKSAAWHTDTIMQTSCIRHIIKICISHMFCLKSPIQAARISGRFTLTGAIYTSASCVSQSGLALVDRRGVGSVVGRNGLLVGCWLVGVGLGWKTDIGILGTSGIDVKRFGSVSIFWDVVYGSCWRWTHFGRDDGTFCVFSGDQCG